MSIRTPKRPRRPQAMLPYDEAADMSDSGHSTHSRTNLTEPYPLPMPCAPLRTTSRPATRPGSPKLNEKRPEMGSRQTTGKAATPLGRSPYGQLPNSSGDLLFAEGDMPNNAVTSFWLRLLQFSIVTRWIIFIVPVVGLLWIPGIVGITAAPGARVWDVKLLYWSIYLTVLYAGWFGGQAAARIGPHVLRLTIGVVAPELNHYIQYLRNIKRNVGISGWALANWICFEQLINKMGSSDKTTGSGRVTSQITKAWLGIFICSLILLVEKLIIQVIARNFHKRSYEDRIFQQKFQIRALTTLYLYSRDIGRSDTLDATGSRKSSPNPSKIFKAAIKGVRKVAQTGATALGTLASEIAGERVLQPNSPHAMVTQALSSQNKSRHLARRLFYNFCPHGSKDLHVEDIQRFFQTREEADQAFAIFDKDGNGDANLDECEMSLVEIHRDRLALASSMRDVDSAVRRLDDILMSAFYVVAILVIVGMLDITFNTLLASAGTLILGLSWLIGTTAQEILLSIIFLFVKHPYDVGDRVRIDTDDYVVKEMHLLSTVFRRLDGAITQMPHTLLNTKPLVNVRRSGPISETFEWHVDYATTFEKIEQLREKMLAFLELERRDFSPSFDVTVQDIPDQAHLVLTVPIKYKSNWQNNSLKCQRRNKFICALKMSLASLDMFGPAGAGNPHPDDAIQLVKMIPNEPAPAYQPQSASPPPQLDATAAPRSNQFNFSSAEDVMIGTDQSIFDGPNCRTVEPDADTLASQSQIQAQRQAQATTRQQYLASDPARRREDIEMQSRDYLTR